jgi:hypothetical protein
MLAANIFTGFVLAPWAGLLLIGILLIQGVADRHLPGYPSAAQIRFSIGVPGTVFILLLSAFVIFYFVRRSPRLLAISAGAAMLFLFPYFYMLAVVAAI